MTSLRRCVGRADFHAVGRGQAVKQQSFSGVGHTDLRTGRLHDTAQLKRDAVGQIGGPEPCFVAGGDRIVDEVLADEVQAHALAEMGVT